MDIKQDAIIVAGFTGCEISQRDGSVSLKSLVGQAFLRAHPGTATGSRAVPARSSSVPRATPEYFRAAFSAFDALRTGTVRGPMGAVYGCAPLSSFPLFAFVRT